MRYPRYGFIPQGSPRWPDTPHDTCHDTQGECADEGPNQRSARRVSAQVSVLPAAPPRRIKVWDRSGKSREIDLSERDGELARRAYERREAVKDVIERMALKGSKQTRAAVACVLLRLPSPNYQIVED